MKRLVALLVLAAVAVAGWLWWTSDARRIGRRLDALVEACEKSGPESPLVLLTRTQTLLDAFAPGLLVRAEPYGGAVGDGRELAALIQRYRATASRIEITASGRELVFGPNRTAEMAVLFRIAGDAGGGPGNEAFSARLFWVEDDGTWRIREVEVIERLESSGLFF